ncbi:sensor histidine kinase [Noviherbaspirillum galbum]|uniref:histidine kinase n=1 Tax=Noviherbaspirillum galbum TaxID=2709383 RepID=A0A6B3SUM1_9BURK|nr:sensor histidine kinase [Noviherbaspirillum galbum]NEX63065.1 hypothetical protein [Noviherbaspirillum galbum]
MESHASEAQCLPARGRQAPGWHACLAGCASLRGVMLALALTLTLALATVACHAAGLAASARNPRFERIAASQGLSHNTVLAVAQDRLGFLWVATQGGLNRYDGNRLLSYRHDPADKASLADDMVYALHVDEGNRLWVGTRGGLQRFSARDGKFITILPEDTRAIVADGKGGIWAGTINGLAHVAGEGSVPTFLRPVDGDEHSLSHARVHVLARDADGQVWIGTENGLDMLRPDGKSVERFMPGVTGMLPRPQDQVRALLPGASGELWIGTEGGIEHWTNGYRKRQRFGTAEGGPRGRVRAIVRDDAGTVWFADLDQGLFRLDARTGRFGRYRHDPADAHSLSSDLVTTLLQDRSGVLWIGTWNAGLNQLNLWNAAFDRIVRRTAEPQALSDNSVNAVLAGQGGKIYVGTLKGGLNVVDRATGEVGVVRHNAWGADGIGSDDVESLYQDASGTIWIGTDRGLSRFDPATRKVTRVRFSGMASGPMFIRAIARDHEGKLWIAASGDLFRVEPGGRVLNRFTHEPGRPDSLRNGRGVNALLVDHEGRLWIGSSGGGLNRYEGPGDGGGVFRHVGADGAGGFSISDDVVTSLHEDRRGDLWVGTANGLDRMVRQADGSLGFERHGLREGLASAAVAAITEDAEGALWFSTDAGLTRLDPGRTRFRHYGATDGMVDGGYSIGAASRAAGTGLVFGGYQGVTVVDTARLRDNPAAPEVRITDLLLSNRSARDIRNDHGFRIDGPVESARQAVLDHHHAMISIEFGAMDFADPSRVRYEYQLAGFDESWHEADARQRSATYTNLDPGSYVFRVKARSKDGVPSARNAELQIVIRPPIWKTWWFIVLLLVLACAMAFLAYRWRIRRLARGYEVERLAIRARAELDSAAAQRRFVAMVSHELRNPLAIMETAVKNLARVDLEALPAPVAQRLEKIQRAQQRVQSLVDNFLTEETLQMPDLMPNKEKVDVLALLREVACDIGASSATHQIALSAPSALPVMKVDREMMRIAFSNLIENAVKYSPDADRVEVEASFTDTLVEVEVKDSGMGIEESDLPNIFEKYFRANHGRPNIKGVGLGLYVVHRIVELHHGVIQVESRVGVGTTFRIQLARGRRSGHDQPRSRTAAVLASPHA